MSAGTARDLLDLVWIVPALPLLGAALLLLFGKRIGEPLAGWIASGLVVLAFAWSVVMFAAILQLPEHARVEIHNIYTWLPAGQLRVNVGFYADPLSITWILLVTGVGALIHLYSIGYMRGDPRYATFFSYLNLFAASMLILVLGSNFLVTFVGWEGVGLCSYLLVSFWFERNAAAVAGKKAFVTNRVGDVGFLLAMFLIFASYRTLDYAALPAGAKFVSSGTATAIALLLFAAAVGKSAQFPLHVWLPDAMEGPTPVSALIHAATMVTAGVFLLCRAHRFLEASGTSTTVIAWIGAATALLAGTIAILQPDIKRALAYSTISQLGYMFLAVGIGAYTAAVFMVVCHAFYKGCLFLGAGSVIHGNHDNQDMRIMGRFARFLPITAFGMVIAWLAIAGMPPFSGFFSKDEIISTAYLTDHYGLWVVALIAAIFTAVYMTRLVFLTFFGNERWHPDPSLAATAPLPDVDLEDSDPTPTVSYGDPVHPPVSDHAPHESPWIMTLPILTLAALAAVAGFVNMPLRGADYFDQWLNPSFPGVETVDPNSFLQGATLELVSAVVAAVGLLVAYLLYRAGLPTPTEDPLDARLQPASPVLGHAYYYDETISKAVDGPGRGLANWLDRVVDRRIIDGAVDSVGALVKRGAVALRHLQDGLVRRYALGFAFGVAALLLYVAVRAG